MCAIAGVFAYHPAALPVDPDELTRIRDRMTARGPDGAGQWLSADGRAGLAHRRLSIIDLSERAAQPMASADGKLVVSFNGEIYNYRELRNELLGQGRVMRTASDTEVILHLYERDGTAMFSRLRGMFAIALWDSRQRALLLARDPFGIKPLYLADDGWTARVGSQVKALLASQRVSRAPEPAGLAGFYLTGSVPEPFTLYQEIRSVPAGSFQWVGALGPQAPQRYFDAGAVWADAEHEKVEATDAQARIRDAVAQSVRRHLVADVPVGAFLSAGIDSGALLGLMRDAGARDVQAVTVVFEEFAGTPADEWPLASEVARRYEVRHARAVVTESEFQSDLPRILDAMDQPSIDGINTWFVSKAARAAGLKVAISGLGGDELFGGYPSFRDVPRWMRALWLPSRIPGAAAVAEQVLGAFAPLMPSLNPKARGMLRHGGSVAGAYLLRRGLFLPSELPALLGDELTEEGLRRLQPLQRIAGSLSARPRSWHGRVATLEMANYMRNQLLRDTDWASMAHSLEVRTPLVDSTLLQSVAAPVLASPAHSGKRLLAACPNLPLPDAVVKRAKTGFTTPVDEWQRRLFTQPSGDTNRGQTLPNRSPWARRWSSRIMTAHAESLA